MEAASAAPILLPRLAHRPFLQEIRSVKGKPFYCLSSVDAASVLFYEKTRLNAVSRANIRSVKGKPFYCLSSVGTIPFQGHVFLLLMRNASLQQLLSNREPIVRHKEKAKNSQKKIRHPKKEEKVKKT